MKWSLEKRSVASLREYPGNPRSFSEKGLGDLSDSISKFGVAEPLVVMPDGMICGGHGRKRVLLDQGIEDVDCYIPERELTHDEFKELNARLNVNVAGTWDLNKLVDGFPDMQKLLDIGFSTFDLKLEGNFKPIMSPDLASGNVSREDMEDADQKLRSDLDREQSLRKAKCPKCGNEFYVD